MNQNELLKDLGFKEKSPNTYIKRNLANDGFDCLTAGQAGISALITGLTVSQLSKDKIQIDKGYCLDDTFFLNMYNPLSKELQIDIENDGTRHIFMIAKLSGEINFISSSELNPKLPMGYFYKRRIWSLLIYKNLIKPFKQLGDKCLFLEPTSDFKGYLPLASSDLKISIPDGLEVQTELYYNLEQLADDLKIHLKTKLTNFSYPVYDNQRLEIYSTNILTIDVESFNINENINLFYYFDLRVLGYEDKRRL